jgi:hypothetical protein
VAQLGRHGERSEQRGDLDGCTEPGPAGADNHDIKMMEIHQGRFLSLKKGEEERETERAGQSPQAVVRLVRD